MFINIFQDGWIGESPVCFQVTKVQQTINAETELMKPQNTNDLDYINNDDVVNSDGFRLYPEISCDIILLLAILFVRML